MATSDPQSTLGKIQAWFDQANQISVPRTPYNAAVLDGTNRNPINDYVDQAVSDIASAQQKPMPPMPPGFTDIANGVREGWQQLENTGSDRLTPQQARAQTIAALQPGQSISPETAMEMLRSTPASPQSELSANPGLNRVAPQADSAPTVSNAGGDLNGTLSYLGNRPAYQAIAKRGEAANLTNQGYRPLELPGSSPNALPTGVMRQQGQGVKGSALPELQAQYAKQGIEFDPNAMYEQMNYAIPGAKGSASGWRKVDPNRQQGSFSVVPGLSDADQQRYKEIVANETRQREYAQGRGKEWDAAQAAQASNAVAALKQMYDREQFNQTQATAQAGHEETKRKNRSDEDWKAAKLEQSIAAEKNQAQKFDPKLIPTVASILEAEQKNAPLGNKLTREQHLSNGLLNYGIKTATDIKNPPDGLFILPDNPDQVFMRDPKTKTVTALSSLDDHLKQWARNRYAGMGTPTVAPAESVQP